MRFRTSNALTAIATAVTLALGAQTASAATGDPVLINEVLASHTGTDDTEYVELFGLPGTTLEGLSLIVVEGDSSGAGTIDRRLDFEASDILGSNGFYLIGNPVGLAANYGVVPNIEVEDNYLENSSLTVALVETASISGDSVSGDEVVLDAVGIDDGGNGDMFFFAAPVIGPDGDFFPAGVRRAVDGVDTDAASDWLISDFNLGADNTPTGGDTSPTPPPIAATIMEIQGAGHLSPLEGKNVLTTGIVTAVDSNGFYIQDPDGDGNDATADGLFVFTGAAPATQSGDLVEVTGPVTEYIPGGASTGNLSTTEIDAAELTVLSVGNRLPEPVRIGGPLGRKPPTANIDDDAFASFDPDSDGLDFYESLEGMRVEIVQPVSVSGRNRFGEIYTLAGGGWIPFATGRSLRGTINIGPDDFNPERVQIQLDSGILPGFDLVVDTGVRLTDVTGVVGYSFGNFEVYPTEPFSELFARTPRPETSRLSPTRHQLTVASYNVLNLDPKIEEGQSSSNTDDDVGNGRFAAIAGQIVDNLRAPDIVALQEVQDNNGAEPGTVAADETLQLLVDEIANQSGIRYEYIDNPFIGDNTSGGQPNGNIRVAFLYNPERVHLVAGTVATIGDPEDQQINPDNPFYDARLPLIATFELNGQTITVVNNHFSSKSGSKPLFGMAQPADQRQEDPAVNGSLDERRAQADAVLAHVDGILGNDPDAKVIVLGDFNEFEFVSPLKTLEQSLVNLTNRLLPNERYSYIFDGNSQSLDHILVTPNLSRWAQFDVVHVNAEYAETPQRASDHDPLLVRLPLFRGR